MTTKADYVLREAKKANTTGHRCHADGCNVKVSPAMFMCRKHWFMAPKALRTMIWGLYEPGQEIKKNPTDLYMKAALEAIDAVARKEERNRNGVE